LALPASRPGARAAFEIALVALIGIGVSSGSFLAVDWALMTDIIPKATTGRYMGSRPSPPAWPDRWPGCCRCPC
jgi:hypothetical protein